MAAPSLGHQDSPREPPANHQHTQQLAQTQQSQATQAERWSPAREAATRVAARAQPRAPSSAAAPPASTQGHPHFSWVPLPSAVPRGTRSSHPRSRDVPPGGLSFQPHPTRASLQSPCPEDNSSQETHLPPVGALETALGGVRRVPNPPPSTSPHWELPNAATAPAGGAEEWLKAGAESTSPTLIPPPRPFAGNFPPSNLPRGCS